LAEIKRIFGRIKASGCAVYALSADSPAISAALKEEMALPFELWCDEDKTVITAFGLLNPDEHGGIAYPAIFVINADGTICYRSLDRTATRVNLKEVLDFLVRFARTPDIRVESVSKKKVIIPKPSALRQLLRNLIKRGNRSDWRHYWQFSLGPIKAMLRKLKP
jgi:alkyl hydroperoxide reductase subunit AhpC